MEFQSKYSCTASALNPEPADVHGTHRFRLVQQDDEISSVADCVLRSSAGAFHLSITLVVTRNGQLFFERQWTLSQPRDLL